MKPDEIKSASTEALRSMVIHAGREKKRLDSEASRMLRVQRWCRRELKNRGKE